MDQRKFERIIMLLEDEEDDLEYTQEDIDILKQYFKSHIKIISTLTVLMAYLDMTEEQKHKLLSTIGE